METKPSNLSAHEAVLTDEEIIKHLEEAGVTFMWIEGKSFIRTTAGSQRVDNLLSGIRALLSKLRAPVADERALRKALQDCEARLALLVHSGRGKLLDAVAAENARAALASAPVAGEAVATVMTCYGGEGRFYLDAICEKGFKPPPGTKLYAAPQASEAVPRAGYAGVTVWVGDRQATQIVTQQGLELSNKDELLERFEVARAALSAQPGAQKEGRDAE